MKYCMQFVSVDSLRVLKMMSFFRLSAESVMYGFIITMFFKEKSSKRMVWLTDMCVCVHVCEF